jgi:hypothetical protein
MKCTPEYNDETRRLQARERDLRRVAKGAEAGHFGEAIRAKANEIMDAGETDEAKVIDQTHEFINEFAPHDKSEIAHAITDTTARTQSEAAARRAEVRARIRDLEHVNEGLDAGEAKRTAAATAKEKARLTNQITDLSRQLAFAVRNAREKGTPIDTPEITALREKRDALKQERDMQEPSPPPTRPVDPNIAKNKAEQARVAKRMEVLKEKIANRDAAPTAKKAKPQWDEKTTQMREEYKKLKEQHDALQEKPAPKDPETARNEREVKRLENEVAKLDEQIAKGEADAKKGKLQGPEIERIAELKAERAAKQKEVNNMRPSPEATRPADPMVAKNKAAITRLGKREKELSRQLAENDFPEEGAGKRTPPNYSEEVKQARLRVRELENQIEFHVQKGERLNAPWHKKLMGAVHAGHLFNIFTSYLVHKKLAAAVLGGHAKEFLSSGTISVLKMIPAIARIAEMSHDYGAGMTAAGLKARYGALGGLIKDTAHGIVTLQAKGAALETLKHGASKLEMALGDPGKMSDAAYSHLGTLTEAMQTEGKMGKAAEVARVLAAYPARSHGFIKQFLSHPAYYESLANQRIQMGKALKKAGLTDAEIESHMNLESVQASMQDRAMARAYDEKMQGKNRWNDAMIAHIRDLEKSDHPFANAVAFIERSLLPVARVGPNVFKQGTSLLFGGVKAALEAAGKGEMTPDRADYIMKNIGSQGVGAILVATGAVFADQIGGVPGAEPKKKKQPGDTEEPIKPGDASLFGLDVGAEAFHGAPAAMLQIGASLRHLYQDEMKMSKDQSINATLISLGSASGKTLWHWGIRTLPITDQIRRISNTLDYGRRHGKDGNPWSEVGGNVLRSMLVPTGLQQYAQATDPNQHYTRPRNVKEDIEQGLPDELFGLAPGTKFRGEVPHTGPLIPK